MMPRKTIVVDTALGLIKGAMDTGSCCWKGIPYALPLVGEQQFLPPQPVQPWHGVLDATSYGGICPQRSLMRSRVSTDCLSLNIWSPGADGKRRPVLFFIHGGSGKHGAGREAYYHGAYLAKTHDVVVVTCNYRLGVYGFLDFRRLDSSFTSNNGLRDVLAALRWVHMHIARFGGDPGCVTVSGQSAGGTMVSSLVTIPAAKGLFHRAIMMSGGPTQVQSATRCDLTTDAFLNHMVISSAKDLLSLDFDTMITGQKRFIRSYGMGAATFRITVDENLVPDFPIHAARRGKVSVPMLIGTTKEEMGFMAIKPLARLIDVGKVIADGLAMETQHVQKQLLDAYSSVYGTERGLPMMYTDLLFRVSSVWFAKTVGSHGNAWMYRFDFETRALRMNGMHAVHSSDLPYVFGNFKPVLVRPMFLLMRDMKSVRVVAEALQKDMVRFMKDGKLDWIPINSGSSIGKCFDKRPVFEPMVHPQIEEIYKATDYQRRSFSGA